MIKIILVSALLLSYSPRSSYVVVSAYCSCEKCCGPFADGVTASGVSPVQGITVAASRRIPFGTKLYIERVGLRVVQDRLHTKYDDRIDVYFVSHKRAKEFGIQRLKVNYINQ